MSNYFEVILCWWWQFIILPSILYQPFLFGFCGKDKSRITCIIHFYNKRICRLDFAKLKPGARDAMSFRLKLES